MSWRAFSAPVFFGSRLGRWLFNFRFNRLSCWVVTLNKIDQQIDAAIKSGDIHGYMRGNYLFHFTLYGHANSRVLLPIAQSLWLRYGPMSRIICGRYGTSNLEDRHEEALQMLRDENPKGVADAIRKDITQGFEIVHEGLFDP